MDDHDHSAAATAMVHSPVAVYCCVQRLPQQPPLQSHHHRPLNHYHYNQCLPRLHRTDRQHSVHGYDECRVGLPVHSESPYAHVRCHDDHRQHELLCFHYHHHQHAPIQRTVVHATTSLM